MDQEEPGKGFQQREDHPQSHGSRVSQYHSRQLSVCAALRAGGVHVCIHVCMYAPVCVYVRAHGCLMMK